MSCVDNSYSFCADYSAMASCLFKIQAQQDAGIFNTEPEILDLLLLLENDLLRKLYNRALGILGKLNGAGGVSGMLAGDFDDFDFSGIDFFTGYLDPNAGLGSVFQSVLNMLAEFCSRLSELSDDDRFSLEAALIPVLDAFSRLQELLNAAGLNLCGSAAGTFYNNSSELHLQAAGADGTDGVPSGIHLRWSLTGDLGSNHIPQGNNFSGTSAPGTYTRAADYVTVSRIAYSDPVTVILDFGTAIPFVQNGLARWTYTVNHRLDDDHCLSSMFRLTFTDMAVYRQTALITDPQKQPFDFLKAYNGMVEIELTNKTAFSVSLDYRKASAAGTASLKVEILSTGADLETATIRQVIPLSGTVPVNTRFLGENIKRIRLQKTAGSYLQSLSVETYADFLAGVKDVNWTTLGSFGLSLDDTTVFQRLEDPAKYPVDHRWPQFNDGTTVRVSNYHDKWMNSRSSDDQSFKAAVARYLELSKTDPRAMDELRASDSDPDLPGIPISYLDIINLLGLDYHVARMLGLGFIDTGLPSSSAQYIYRITYTNRENLTSAQLVTRQYLSLPTGLADSRLPAKPEIRDVTYRVQDPASVSTSQFDADGYTNIENVRAVNIGRKPLDDEIPSADFFSGSANARSFDIFANARPVLYGIEYRPEGQAAYVQPEITASAEPGDYLAYNNAIPAGVPETVPVLDSPDSLFVHFEHYEGIHHYAIYGISIFARPSVLSDEADTTDTAFKRKNTLSPPTDLAVQYIQYEDTLIFTTAQEQAWLAGRKTDFPLGDIGFTRVTFNYLDITDISYLPDQSALQLQRVVRPDLVKACFKPDLPLQIGGVINDILVVPGASDQLILATGPYALPDASTRIDPAVTGLDYNRFTGSLLVTPEGQFTVLSISPQFVTDPATQQVRITIQKFYTSENIQDTSDHYFPNTFYIRESYISPELGARFTVVENTGNKLNWNPVTETVQLLDVSAPAPPLIETQHSSEGDPSYFWVGGITAGAQVAKVHDVSNGQELLGYYLLTFDAGTVLAPHPQVNLPYDPGNPGANAPDNLQPAHVEWYKGLIRVPVGMDKKLLEVVRIDQLNPLVLYIYDPTYADASIIPDLKDTVHMDGLNFHPGYRVYYLTEPAPGGTLNRQQILPPPSKNDKKSLISLETTGGGFVSPLTPPAVLMARNIAEPVKPGILPAAIKVRPDATGKAAFTFDITIYPDTLTQQPRNPFGFMFYRTSNEDLLHALYAPATADAILTQLEQMPRDGAFNQRYLDLANLDYDPANPGTFKSYDGYGFPPPDRAGFPAIGDRLAAYAAAVRSTLLPLTEQPPLFAYLNTGLQTQNTAPVIRTIDGYQLQYGDPKFNPFPMVTKYPGTTTGATNVRITDYTLIASARFLYFYAAAEITNQLAVGPLSLFTGPVTVLHTLPAAAPLIHTYSIDDTFMPSISPIAVTFDLAPFSPAEGDIYQVRIYRTTDQQKTVALGTMDSFLDVALTGDISLGSNVTDDFSDLSVALTGETVYYRLAFVRRISNELDQPEDVLSLGSAPIAIRLIDTVNPPAPLPVFDGSGPKLTWTATANKATYYVYRQNARGNWQQVAKVLPGQPLEYPLGALPQQDSDGNTLYYRYKIKAENSSGLTSLADVEITISL